MPYDITNTTIPGPAIITFNSGTFYSLEDIKVVTKKSLGERKSAMFGTLKRPVLDVTVEITLTPTQYDTTAAGKLWPYRQTAHGARLIGASDTPLVIHSTSGLKRTYHRAAITKMPSLNCSIAADSTIGEMTFTAVAKNGVDPSTSNALFTDATEAFSNTSFDPAKLITGPFALSFGSSPYNDIATQEGVKIDFNLEAKPFPGGENGTRDFLLTSLDCEATFKPVNLTAAEYETLLDIQGTASAGIGATTSGATLTITATNFEFSMFNTIVTEGQGQYGIEDQYAGELKAITQRSVTTGALNPLFEFGANT